jgi:hypothetical protein
MIKQTKSKQVQLLIRIIAFCGLNKDHIAGNARLGIRPLSLKDFDFGSKEISVPRYSRKYRKFMEIRQPVDGLTVEMVREYAHLKGIEGDQPLFAIERKRISRTILFAGLRARVPVYRHSWTVHKLQIFFLSHIQQGFGASYRSRVRGLDIAV